MEYLARCTVCSETTDVKTKTRFNKIKHTSYRCKSCIVKDRTYFCRSCQGPLIFKSPFYKRKAEEFGLICNQCRNPPLTAEQEQFLSGLMLGDGSIVYPNKNASQNPRLQTRRQVQDLEYLEWQHSLFEKFYSVGPTPVSQYDRRTDKLYSSYHLQSRTCEIFKNWHKTWYPDGKKIIPKDLRLSPLTLLVWFLDDGCIIKKSESNLILKLATNGFKPEDTLFLAKLLEDFLGEKISMYRNGNGYILRGSTKTSRKLISIIEPIFPSFMSRKKTWIKK